MELKTREIGSTVVIDVTGEIDIYSSPEFRKVMLANAKEGTARKVVINLTGVSYLDSSGVGSLVEALQWANRSNRAFAIYGLGTRARAVFELARLDKVFRICATEQEALQD